MPPAGSPSGRRMAPWFTTSTTAGAHHAAPRGVAACGQLHRPYRASTGSVLPRFIKDAFDALLECGIRAHGCLRLRCGGCGPDKLLAFSCKRRGFCPS